MEISWYLQGEPVVDDDLVRITKLGHRISTLSIDAVSAKHAGTYSCVASNAAGNDTKAADLHVQSKHLNHKMRSKAWLFLNLY